MAFSSAALVMLLVASCAAMAAATTYNVGDENGWATGVNYSDWTSGKSFVVGDKLVFHFRINQAHSVTEVSQLTDYASCSTSHGVGISEDISPSIITLESPGTHYYICLYHCDGGMKLAVTVSVPDSGYGPSSGGGVTLSGATQLVPAMGAVIAAAAGALTKAALF